MTKTISFINHKGGVGKTTVCAHIGYALATFHGQRVLLVDYDHQANLTELFAPDSSGDVIAISETLHIMPATLELAHEETALTLKGEKYALKWHLSNIRDNYDFILIDCPPSLGSLTVNALFASTDVCVVSDAGKFSLKGLTTILDVVSAVQKENPRLRVSSAVLNNYETRRSDHNEALATFQSIFPETFLPQPIRHIGAIEQSVWFGTTVFDKYKTSNAVTDFQTLSTLFLQRYV